MASRLSRFEILDTGTQCVVKYVLLLLQLSLCRIHLGLHVLDVLGLNIMLVHQQDLLRRLFSVTAAAPGDQDAHSRNYAFQGLHASLGVDLFRKHMPVLQGAKMLFDARH